MTNERDHAIAARQKERDILFANETFVISVLQAVSGGSIVAALAQFQAMSQLVGRSSYLVFLTLMIVALGCAVLAAYWKHQYKLFGIKWQLRMEGNEPDIALKLRLLTDIYLNLMRGAMLIAVSSIVLSLCTLIAASWIH